MGSFSPDDFLPGDATRLRIGEWIADQPTLRLERPGTILPTEPKVMDLLFLLAAARPEVVSKEKIFEALWSGVHVGEESLARCISKLRAQLGDDARNPRYIETIPKRGYRLIADVYPIIAPAAVSEARTPRLAGWVGGAALIALAALLIALATPRAAIPPGSDEQRLRELSDLDRKQAQDRRQQQSNAVVRQRSSPTGAPPRPKAMARPYRSHLSTQAAGFGHRPAVMVLGERP